MKTKSQIQVVCQHCNHSQKVAKSNHKVLRFFCDECGCRNVQTIVQNNSFNTEHYNNVKEFTENSLNRLDYRLAEKFKDKPFEWAMTFLPMIANCVESEDYEGAKAMSDAIREFLNRFLPANEQISESAKLNLPEFKEEIINVHVSYASEIERDNRIK